MKPKVIIEVKGGMIVNVSSDVDVDAMIVDYDIESTDEEALVQMPFTGQKAGCSIYDVDVSAKKVRNLYNIIEKDLQSM